MVVEDLQRPRLRLAELLAALSLATDLGMSHPPEEAIRSCLLAAGLARRMILSEPDVADIYYTTLLKYVGCTAYAHEEAAMFGGDDLALRSDGALVDFANPREAMSFTWFGLARDAPVHRRMAVAAGAMYNGVRYGAELDRSHCEVASNVARRLGLHENVSRGLYQIFERWDGKGNPDSVRGDDVSLASRFAQVATRAMIFYRVGGLDAACAMVRKWSGKMLDPFICEAFIDSGPDILREIGAADPMQLVAEREPQPWRQMPENRIDDVARVFADMVDLKATFTRGHSPAVAELSRAAAIELDLDHASVTGLFRSALLHDLGRVSVPNGIWDKQGLLTSGDWERIRLHAYHSERILSYSPSLSNLAAIAGMHHERLDGSGYHRQSVSSSIPVEARVLAAADCFHAMTSDRPYRPAMSSDAAAQALRTEVESNRLDHDAVGAVLVAAGQRSGPVRRSWPAGLSDREVEVLRLIARGSSTRDVGRNLSISPKTAGHHIQHIYNKLGISTRAAAAMFAMEHDLLI